MRTFAACLLTSVMSVAVVALSACSEHAALGANASAAAGASGAEDGSIVGAASTAAGARGSGGAGESSGTLRGPGASVGATSAIAHVPLDLEVIAVGIVKSQVGAEVKVGSQLSGIVAKLHVNVGDAVKRGDALAELDDAQWRARVTSLEAELAGAEAELAYARSDVSRMARVASYSPAQVENGRRNAQVREAIVGQARAKLDEARVEL